jgi:hypothetical protein
MAVHWAPTCCCPLPGPPSPCASSARKTLSKHQLWSKTYLGLRELDIDDEAALKASLLAQAADASHAEDLVQSASQWLFTRRILIPGARCPRLEPERRAAGPGRICSARV